MKGIPLALSVLGLASSFLAFGASFLGLSCPMVSGVLMMLAMAQFGPLLAKFPRTSSPTTILEHREAWGRLWRSRPRWLLRLTHAAVANAVIQVIAYFLLIPWGSASQSNGGYVLRDKSRIIRELTELEYRGVLASDARVSSAILTAVFFYLVVYYWRSENQ